MSTYVPRTILATALAISLVGCTTNVPLKNAMAGQAADVAITAAGLELVSGVAEANPLKLALLLAKPTAIGWANELAEPARTNNLYMLGAFGWGATAHNACVLTVAITGGASAVACPIIGVLGGVYAWDLNYVAREQAAFQAICNDAKLANPALVCTYTAPKV